MRITVPVLKVLQVLIAADPDEHAYGLMLCMRTGLKSGTLYPVLARLERAGWVESAWEGIEPRVVGRPRRRCYWLTVLGQRFGAAELAKFAWPTPPAHRIRSPRIRVTAWGTGARPVPSHKVASTMAVAGSRGRGRTSAGRWGAAQAAAAIRGRITTRLDDRFMLRLCPGDLLSAAARRESDTYAAEQFRPQPGSSGATCKECTRAER